MKSLLSKGIGTKVRKADPISKEDEEKLWVNGVFGLSSSTTLQYTMFYYNCKLFGLRGRDEHRSLDTDQFEIGDDNTGKFVRFVGRTNKTFKGGLGEMRLENKDLKHYSSGGPRCIIQFYEAYLKAVGSGVFYRKPLNADGKVAMRYGKAAIGVNKLSGLMKGICQKGGLSGNYTNHSGKRTCATALYRAGVDEQEIMERTGHRSTKAVRAYKTSDGNIQKKVSEILSPEGMKENSEDNASTSVSSKKRCLNDITNTHGSAVKFSNCHFNFN